MLLLSPYKKLLDNHTQIIERFSDSATARTGTKVRLELQDAQASPIGFLCARFVPVEGSY
jgi:hypothetical protein